MDAPTHQVETGARIIDLRAPDVVSVPGAVKIDARGVPNYRPVQEAAAAAVAAARPGQLILLEDPPYVGATVELIADPLLARGLVPGQDMFVAARVSGPAFTVIGGVTRDCTRRAMLWVPGAKGAPAPVSSAAAAEFIGLAASVMAAASDALRWELGDLGGALGLDEAEVLPAAELLVGDGRNAAALAWQVRAVANAPVLEAVLAAQRGHARAILSRIEAALAQHGQSLAWSRVLICGDGTELGGELARLIAQAGGTIVPDEADAECDLVVLLGEESPRLAASCYPMVVGPNGQPSRQLAL